MMTSSETTHSFNLMTHKITQRERHNGLYHVISDLDKQSMDLELAIHPTIQTVRNHLQQFHCEHFIRRSNNAPALLLRLKQHQDPLFLGYTCEEEHLTFDAKYDRRNPKLACTHYKLVLRRETDVLTIRYYINHRGELLDLSIKLGIETKNLAEHDPLYVHIQTHITMRMRPFLTLLSDLVTAKPVLIFNLNQNAFDHNEDFSPAQLVTMDLEQRALFVAKLNRLIKQIETRNQYDDDEQDVRSEQLKVLLSFVQTPPSLIQNHPSTAVAEETSTEATEPVIQRVAPIATNALTRNAAKHKLCSLVDQVLSLLTHDLTAEYELFLKHADLLIELEIECWALLSSADNSYVKFVQKQKNRLSIAHYNLGDYFFHKMLVGDIVSIQHLLPHISLPQKYGFYNRLLERIEEDTAPFSCAPLYSVARFLYEHDSAYRAVFQLTQNDGLRQAVPATDSANNPFCRRSLAYMCATNNIEGFRLFVEQQVDLRQAQIMTHELQLHSLDACILLCSIHSNFEFVKILLQHGMNVQDTTQTISINNLKFSKHKTNIGTATYKAIQIPSTVQRERSNSLIFALNYSDQKANLALIELLAQHSDRETHAMALAFVVKSALHGTSIALMDLLAPYNDLESLAMACARSLVADSDFSSLFFFAANSVVEVVDSVANDKASKEALATPHRARLGSPLGFAYIFSPQSMEVAVQKVPAVRLLLNHFEQRCHACSDADKRVLFASLLAQAQQKQKAGDDAEAQLRALAMIVAAVFVWGKIQDRQLDDCKQFFRLIQMKVIVHARVHATLPNHAVRMRSFYQAALDFADHFPDPVISNALKQENIYKIFKKNVENTLKTDLEILSMFGIRPNNSQAQNSNTQTLATRDHNSGNSQQQARTLGK